jgi:hypothetical protein
MRQLPLVEQAMGRQALAMLCQPDALAPPQTTSSRPPPSLSTSTRTPGSSPARRVVPSRQPGDPHPTLAEYYGLVRDPLQDGRSERRPLRWADDFRESIWRLRATQRRHLEIGQPAQKTRPYEEDTVRKRATAVFALATPVLLSLAAPGVAMAQTVPAPAVSAAAPPPNIVISGY